MEIQVKQILEIPVISRQDRVTIPRIPAHSGPAIQSLIESLNRLGVQPAGSEIIYVYHGCNGDPAQEFDLEICLPIAPGLSPRPGPPIEMKTIAPFRCATVDYVGPMSGIGQAWMKLVNWIRGANHKPTAESREVYKKWVAFDSADNITELQQGIE